MNPLTYIPATVRQYVYVGYAVTGVLIGATQAGYLAAQAAQPVALTVALGVYAYLGIALGFTAASNVHAEAEVEYVPELLDEDDEDLEDES